MGCDVLTGFCGEQEDEEDDRLGTMAGLIKPARSD